MKNAPEADQARLKHSIELLRKNGALEYTGEYGAEITTFIPFVAWLKKEGLLSGRKIVTYAGMRPYYFFLDDNEFEEKQEPRRWLPNEERYWPTNSTYTAVKSPWHCYPDYRKHYAGSGRTFERPVLFVQNKFTVEWLTGPINYMPINSLKTLFELTRDHFDVVYSRPRERMAGYSADHNTFCDYPDRAVLADFPHVIDFEQSCQANKAEYNREKLEILAKARLFIAVQGGGAHILSCFGNSLLLLLHHHIGAKEEYPHAYQHGPYKYLSPKPPKLLVARDFADFHRGAEIIAHARFKEGKIMLPKAAMGHIRKLTL